MTTIVDITEALTREQFCLSLFIDLAKAFNIVHHVQTTFNQTCFICWSSSISRWTVCNLRVLPQKYCNEKGCPSRFCPGPIVNHCFFFIGFCSSSLTYMTIHDHSFAGGEEHWGNGSLDQERRFRFGSEVNSLSLSRSSSSDKSDPLENFRLTSNIKWESSQPASWQFHLIIHENKNKCGHKSLIQQHCRIFRKYFFSFSSPAFQMLHDNLQSRNNVHHRGPLQCE